MLRALGFAPRDLATSLLTQTGLLGLAAGLVAVPLGTGLAALLVHVINRRSFGWTMDFAPTLGPLACGACAGHWRGTARGRVSVVASEPRGAGHGATRGMSVRLVLALSLLLIARARARARAATHYSRARISASVTCAGRTTPGFAKANEPRPLAFPADHGSHPQFRTEWWYFTGNLEVHGRGSLRVRADVLPRGPASAGSRLAARLRVGEQTRSGWRTSR